MVSWKWFCLLYNVLSSVLGAYTLRPAERLVSPQNRPPARARTSKHGESMGRAALEDHLRDWLDSGSQMGSLLDILNAYNDGSRSMKDNTGYNTLSQDSLGYKRQHSVRKDSSKTLGSKIKRLHRRETPERILNYNNPVPNPNENIGNSRPRNGALSQKEALALVDTVQSGDIDCSRMFSVHSLNVSFPDSWTKFFHEQTVFAVNTANILNNIFRAWDSFPTSLYNDAFYYSLTKAFLTSDPNIVGATIAFDRDQYLFYPDSSRPAGSGDPRSFAPFVRRKAGDNIELSVLDIAKMTKSKYTANGTAGYEWFWKQRKSFSELLWENRSLCSKVSPQEVVASFSSIAGVMSTAEQGLWTQPYYDCQRTQQWVLTYSVPFFGCNMVNNMSQILFKGVVAVDVALRDLDIDQCDSTDVTTYSADNIYAGTHKCRETTKCVKTPGYGLRLGGYRCECLPGYFFSNKATSDNSQVNYFLGEMVEEAYKKMLINQSISYNISYKCLLCGKGCGDVCYNATPCVVDYDIMIRSISLGVASFCMSVCLILMVVVIRMRKTKVMKASMWILLEIILLGSLFLYSTIIIQYFEPTDLTCILIPWFREVGFAIVYGAIVLKIYRILSEFQSRKAHRVHVRDKDLLKYTFTIVIIVVGFMAAWTLVNLDYILKDGTTLVTQVPLPDTQLSATLCRQMWWEYVIELGEFLLLLFGIFLCRRIRSAPSDYLEGRYLSLAVYNETLISTLTHIIRHFVWGVIHPDYLFLMYFVRCQLTVSLCVILVLGPKLWYAHRPLDDDHFRNRAYSSSDVHDSIAPESMKLHAGVNSNGDVDVTEINLSDMDPEDIRSELKRLYTQLQIYKTKTMRKDNPHISKRRGGRKQTHRRFSLQAFHHKHRHHHEHDHHDEVSKTPEESTNSAEGVAYSIEESTCSVGDMIERKAPTVTFKPGHKSFY